MLKGLGDAAGCAKDGCQERIEQRGAEQLTEDRDGDGMQDLLAGRRGIDQQREER